MPPPDPLYRVHFALFAIISCWGGARTGWRVAQRHSRSCWCSCTSRHRGARTPPPAGETATSIIDPGRPSRRKLPVKWHGSGMCHGVLSQKPSTWIRVQCVGGTIDVPWARRRGSWCSRKCARTWWRHHSVQGITSQYRVMNDITTITISCEYL